MTTLARELTQLVNSGRGEAQMYAGFEGILARYADMPAVAASVLGPPWRGASAGQRQAFVAAFQRYLSRRYGKQFREYRNARIDVTGARDGGKAGVLVKTTVVRPGQEDIAVDWQVSDRSGSAQGGEPDDRGGLDARQRAGRDRGDARCAARAARRADRAAPGARLEPCFPDPETYRDPYGS